MRITEMIASLQKIAQEHGDVYVFTKDGWNVAQVYIDTELKDWCPADWNMPDKGAIISFLD